MRASLTRSTQSLMRLLSPEGSTVPVAHKTQHITLYRITPSLNTTADRAHWKSHGHYALLMSFVPERRHSHQTKKTGLARLSGEAHLTASHCKRRQIHKLRVGPSNKAFFDKLLLVSGRLIFSPFISCARSLSVSTPARTATYTFAFLSPPSSSLLFSHHITLPSISLIFSALPVPLSSFSPLPSLPCLHVSLPITLPLSPLPQS